MLAGCWALLLAGEAGRLAVAAGASCLPLPREGVPLPVVLLLLLQVLLLLPLVLRNPLSVALEVLPEGEGRESWEGGIGVPAGLDCLLSSRIDLLGGAEGEGPAVKLLAALLPALSSL